jgi:hypothetical protein
MFRRVLANWSDQYTNVCSPVKRNLMRRGCSINVDNTIFIIYYIILSLIFYYIHLNRMEPRPLSMARTNHASQTHTHTQTNGTKKRLCQWDSQLVCTRYHDDTERRLRFTTVTTDHRTNLLVGNADEDGWCDLVRRPCGCERGTATTGHTKWRSVAPQPVYGSCRVVGRRHSE